MGPRRSTDDANPDRYGFDETSSIASALGKFVPQRLARLAVSVDLELDQRTYDRGENVHFTVIFYNRLPVPITVATPTLRLWGWEIDGELEASDEVTNQSDTPGSLTLPARRQTRASQVWNGRLKRTGAGPDGRDLWELPEPGTHELSAFVATEPPCARATVELELR